MQVRAIRRSCKDPRKVYTTRFQRQCELSPTLLTVQDTVQDTDSRQNKILEVTRYRLKRIKQKLERFKIPVPDLIEDSEGTIWRKGQLLGQGGFARVFRAVREPGKLNKINEIAIKCVKRCKLKPRQLGHWNQEIKIATVVNHCHVVEYLGSFEFKGFSCLTMQLCKKQTLMQLIRRRKRISEGEATYFVRQTIEGLQYLHAKRILHRDIKLGNLFLDKKMQVRIGDFGLAKYFPEGKQETAKTVCGTPNYLAPEIIKRQPYSYAVDVWSLGCVLYALLFGKCPFQTKSIRATYKRILIQPFITDKHSSPALVSLLNCMLHKVPAQRIKSSDLLNHPFFANSKFLIPKALPSLAHYSECKIKQRQPTVQ